MLLGGRSVWGVLLGGGSVDWLVCLSVVSNFVTVCWSFFVIYTHMSLFRLRFVVDCGWLGLWFWCG